MSKVQADKIVELQTQGWEVAVPVPVVLGGPVKMLKNGQTCVVMPDGTVTTMGK